MNISCDQHFEKKVDEEMGKKEKKKKSRGKRKWALPLSRGKEKALSGRKEKKQELLASHRGRLGRHQLTGGQGSEKLYVHRPNSSKGKAWRGGGRRTLAGQIGDESYEEVSNFTDSHKKAKEPS